MVEVAQCRFQAPLGLAEQLNQFPALLVQVAPQKMTTAARKKVIKRRLPKNRPLLQRKALRQRSRLQRLVQKEGARRRKTAVARKKIKKSDAQAKMDVLLTEAHATLEGLDEVAQEAMTTAKKKIKRKRRKARKTTPAPAKLDNEERIRANEDVAEGDVGVEAKAERSDLLWTNSV